MKHACDLCNDSGKRRGSDFLDCSCPAATERAELECEAEKFAADYKGPLDHLASDLRWHIHQRASRIEREANMDAMVEQSEMIGAYARDEKDAAERIAELERQVGELGASAPVLEIAGKVIEVGDMDEGRGFSLDVGDGRYVSLVRLTDDQARSIAPLYWQDVTIVVAAKEEA